MILDTPERGGRGVKKGQNFADVLYGWPLTHLRFLAMWRYTTWNFRSGSGRIKEERRRRGRYLGTVLFVSFFPRNWTRYMNSEYLQFLNLGKIGGCVSAALLIIRT